MGRYAELNKGSIDNITIKLMDKFPQIKDKDELKGILALFGEISGDNYYIMNNEFYEDYNSYYQVGRFIDAYYNINEETQGDSFDIICWETKEAKCNISARNVEFNGFTI